MSPVLVIAAASANDIDAPMAVVQYRSVRMWKILGLAGIVGATAVGVAAGLGAALTFASYLVLGERLGRDYAILTMMTWGFVFASVVWLVTQPLWTFPTDLSTTAWVEMVWVGLIGTALPFFASFGALQRVASGIVGVIATTEPVFSAAAAWVLLDQHLSAAQITGGLIVLAAVASIQRWGIAEVETPLEAAR